MLERAGFKPAQSLSIVQLMAQLVIGHAMWPHGVDVVLVPERTADTAHVEHALATWDADHELTMGIDALIAVRRSLL